MTLSLTTLNGLRAFNHRNYRLFFIGQAISLIGTWMQQVAQSWLILTLTHDPIWLGVIVAAQFLPVLVFGLFAGVIADSWPKRRLLLVTQVTKMILAFIVFVLVVTGSIQVWMLVLIALALGVANAVDMPVRQSFGIEMVGREDLINAVALNSAMFNGARVIGPAIGGIVIATLGIAPAFLFDALSFLAVIVGLLMMREQDLHGTGVAIRRPESFSAVIESLREGITYVRTTPIVLLATVTVGVVSTVAMNFQVLIPPFAESTLGVGADGFGFLMAASGAGSLTAALWLAFGGRAKPLLLCLGAVLLGAAEIVLGFTTIYALCLTLMFTAGFGAILMATSANTTIQLNVPDVLRGRVSAVYTTVFVGSTPFGGLMIGWLASTIGPALTMIASGLSAFVFGLFALAWLRSIERRERASVGTPIPATATSQLGGSMAPARRR